MESKDTQCYRCRGYGHVSANCTNGILAVIQSESEVLAEETGISPATTVRRRATSPGTAPLERALRKRDASTVEVQAILPGIANV